MIFSKGKVYFSGGHGHIIQYSPKEDAFKNTNLKTPASAGKRVSQLNQRHDGDG